MFSAKLSSASVTRLRCSRSASESSSARSSRPATRRVPFRKRLPPRTVISSPSPTFSNRSAPGASISRTPPRTRRSGPGFGYRPVCESETFTTTRTPDSSSSSAETRSRSAWSMIATSSAESRRTRCFVRRSSRACPLYSTKLIERSRETLDRRAYVGARPSAPIRRRCSMRVCVGSPGTFSTRRWRSATLAICGRCVIVTHLRALAQPAQRLCDRMPGLAADSRVDLVEDQRHLPSCRGSECERDAAELAAGRGLGDRGEREAGVRADQERHCVRPSGAELALVKLDMELALAQADPAELGGDRGGEAARRTQRAPRGARRRAPRRVPGPPRAPRPPPPPDRRRPRAHPARRVRRRLARAALRRTRSGTGAWRPRSAPARPRRAPAGRARPPASRGTRGARRRRPRAVPGGRAARPPPPQARAPAARAARSSARPSRSEPRRRRRPPARGPLPPPPSPRRAR